jgi:hypothetical protein
MSSVQGQAQSFTISPAAFKTEPWVAHRFAPFKVGHYLAFMQYDGASMTLGNMRAQGVRSIYILCGCGREESMLVDGLADDLEVPSIRTQLRCSACGQRPYQTRPDWREHKASGRR